MVRGRVVEGAERPGGLRLAPIAGQARPPAHAQRFAQVRPACTFIEVSRFVDPEWLVEFELDAIVSD